MHTTLLSGETLYLTLYGLLGLEFSYGLDPESDHGGESSALPSGPLSQGGHCTSSGEGSSPLQVREGLILLPHWGSPRPPPVQLTGLGISVVLMTIITSKGYESKLTKEKVTWDKT